jgi:6-phosphogluconolactonase/glucosamine-6-phosphate isomerase/deaminase
MKYNYTNNPIEDAAKDIAETIIKHLDEGQRVLWLLSGGSSIPIAIKAGKMLKSHDLSKLAVTLSDERYGEVGHKDENWQQLLDGGLDLPGATMYRPLIGKEMQKTTELFDKWLSEQFNQSDFNIGIFGLGEDGHTAGIKPNSKATRSTDLAACFTGDDFKRITIGFVAISKLDEAVIQASGMNKRNVIHALMYYDMPLEEQPAQILNTIPKKTIYTDNAKEDL